MRSIRCDACGMKALLAASQCPHCGHLFEIRDSFGELLPLAHCPTCDSDYPLNRGECRWCGTKPDGFRIAPYAWKGAAVLAFLGLSWGAWLARRSTAEDPSTPQSQAAEKSDSVVRPADSGAVSRTLAQRDSADTARHETPSDVVAVDAIPVEFANGVAPTQPTTSVDTMPVSAPTTVAPRARSSSKAPAPPTRRVRWVVGVARAWIPVRASANPKSRIVASIGPDTRVQLGEVRGTWIRLRIRGLSGWVERRYFLARSESAR